MRVEVSTPSHRRVFEYVTKHQPCKLSTAAYKVGTSYANARLLVKRGVLEIVGYEKPPTPFSPITRCIVAIKGE